MRPGCGRGIGRRSHERTGVAKPFPLSGAVVKAKGVVWAGWIALIFAAAFGASLVACLADLDTGSKHGSWLGVVIVSGI